MFKKIFGVMILLAILILPQSVSATKDDWYDKNFYFRNVRDVIVFDVTISPGVDYGGTIALRNMKDTFIETSRKLKCNVITEAQAYRTLGNQLGMNLEDIAYSNPMQARQIVMQNAYRIADAWVIGNVDVLTNNFYIEPERTVWETRKETHYYRDRHGNRREEVSYVQVPVTYPPQRVDVSTIEMTMQMYEARRGEVVFARKDSRDRKEFQAQKGMYGRICKDFFDDVGKKIH